MKKLKQLAIAILITSFHAFAEDSSGSNASANSNETSNNSTSNSYKERMDRLSARMSKIYWSQDASTPSPCVRCLNYLVGKSNMEMIPKKLKNQGSVNWQKNNIQMVGSVNDTRNLQKKDELLLLILTYALAETDCEKKNANTLIESFLNLPKNQASLLKEFRLKTKKMKEKDRIKINNIENFMQIICFPLAMKWYIAIPAFEKYGFSQWLQKALDGENSIKEPIFLQTHLEKISPDQLKTCVRNMDLGHWGTANKDKWLLQKQCTLQKLYTCQNGAWWIGGLASAAGAISYGQDRVAQALTDAKLVKAEAAPFATRIMAKLMLAATGFCLGSKVGRSLITVMHKGYTKMTDLFCKAQKKVHNVIQALDQKTPKTCGNFSEDVCSNHRFTP